MYFTNKILNINKLVKSSFFRMKKIYSWQRGVKNLFLLRDPLLRVGLLIKKRYSKSYISSIMVLLLRLNNLNKRAGIRYTCLYMKACSLYIIKFVVKDPNKPHCNTYGVKVSLTGRGIPRILPTGLRSLIYHNNYDSIRHILTIFALFRVLPFDARLSTSSITDPNTSVLPDEFGHWLKWFYSTYINLEVEEPFGPRLMRSSGTMINIVKDKNTSAFWVDAIKALYVRRLLPSVINIIKSYPITNGSQSWITLFDSILKIKYFRDDIPERVPHNAISRLSIKIEPGKIRLFAIVDILTQWTLRPLHNGLFKVLKRWDATDATFDQDRGFNIFLSKLSKGTTIYSYDLSAATDRLPITLQKMILNHFKPGFGDAWANLLTDRVFLIKYKPKKLDGFVRYLTGQPMGAYSSWAMLALTHHVILQYSAYKVYKTYKWFDLYCILGDDIIIGDTNVARYYYMFMTKVLNVKINLAKSLISSNFGEFAKRIRSSKTDLSPLSLKEFSSWGKVSGAFVQSLTKYPNVSLSKILRILGKGSFSSGNKNLLATVFSEVKTFLNPELTVINKFLITIQKETLAEKEAALKYLLWSKIWETHLQFSDYKRELLLNYSHYSLTVNKVISLWNIPNTWLNIIRNNLESSHLFKSIIFGAHTTKLDRLEKLLSIRLKPYNKVSLNDLIFIWDMDFKSEIVNPSLITNEFDHLSKIDSKSLFKVDYDSLNKYMKFSKMSKLYFLDITS